MIFRETKLSGVFIIEMEENTDNRGFFGRIFCKREFRENGIDFDPVQINLSYSKYKHTLRGLHYQKEPYPEAKLLRCIRGSIYDVAIDLCKESSTFMNWIGVELSEENRRMIYVPPGFAHGYLTLQDNTEVTYPVSEFYEPEAEKGIRWNDPLFDINWPAKPKNISDKDQNWPNFQDYNYK